MNIGVFFGGKSPEHDVSIITGQLVISELKKMQHNVVPIYLGKNGEWYISQELGTLKFFQDKEKYYYYILSLIDPCEKRQKFLKNFLYVYALE